MSQEVPYFKLYPYITPEDEICHCTDNPPILLMYALGENPIHCLRCNLEVPPERLKLTKEVVEAVATWRDVYGSIEHLWLDSGEYEQWALKELGNISSPANIQGREVQSALNAFQRCYYHFFQDESNDNILPLKNCPSCNKPLQKDTYSKVNELFVCEICSIIL